MYYENSHVQPPANSVSLHLNFGFLARLSYQTCFQPFQIKMCISSIAQ